MSEPRINVYTCSFCGQYTVTVDVAAGVTPFTIRCQAQTGCPGVAVSAMYPRGPKPPWIGDPTHEWYSPEGADLRGLSLQEQAHVASGGLLLRPRTSATAVMHPEVTA